MVESWEATAVQLLQQSISLNTDHFRVRGSKYSMALRRERKREQPLLVEFFVLLLTTYDRFPVDSDDSNDLGPPVRFGSPAPELLLGRFVAVKVLGGGLNQRPEALKRTGADGNKSDPR